MKEFKRDATEGAARLAPLNAPTSAATLPQFIEAQGNVLGPLLYQQQQDVMRAAADRLQALQRRLTGINAAVAEQRAIAEELLAPYRERMDHLYDQWLAASAAYEQHRVECERDLVSLINEAAEVVKAINAPPHEGRVKQWLPTTNAPQHRDG